MKNRLMAGAAAALLALLLGGCRADPKAAEGTSVAGQDAAQPAATDTVQPSPAPADVPAWETHGFTSGPFSMELPVNWDEVPGMGSYTAMFFTDTTRDLDSQPSNIVIELPLGAEERELPEIDYRDPEIQQEFFAFLEENAKNDTGELKNFEKALWEQPLTFIIAYDRETADGKTARQTRYYPVDAQYHAMVVYATDFGDSIAPPLPEVVHHMLVSWQSEWAKTE